MMNERLSDSVGNVIVELETRTQSESNLAKT